MNKHATKTLPLLLGLMLAVAVLFLDLTTPLGFVGWLLYLLIFFLLFDSLDRRLLLTLTTICTIFILAKLLLPIAGNLRIYGIANRTLGVVMLWVSGVWLLKLKRTQTELAAAREAFAASEQRLHALFDTVAVGIIEVDTDDCIVSTNAKVSKILGYDSSELIGMSIHDLTAPEDRERSRDLNRAIHGGQYEVADYEKRYLRKDGSRVWVHVTVSAMRDLNGIFTGAVGTVEDISTRKAAEEELGRTTSLLTALSQSTPDPMYAKDCHGRFTFMNPASERVIGRPVADLLGKTHAEWLKDPAEFEVLQTNDRRVIETGETLVVEETMTTPYGRRTFLGSKTPLYDEDGRICGLVGISRDITERKRDEEELRMAKEDLESRVVERTRALMDALFKLRAETEERLRTAEELRVKERLLIQQSRQAAMGEMISNISHQWRQPLNILGLLVQELRFAHQRGRLTGEYLDGHVSKAMDVIADMSRTIDDFRNFFSPDKVKVSFQLRESLQKALGFMEGVFRHLQVSIDLDCPEEISLEGLKNEFSQVILNILANARDIFRERSVPEPRLTIRIFLDQERPVITIADNGGGIPPEIIDKVFDPYFTTKGPDRGTGIGLFMSKTIIEKNMGGRLTVRNTGEGAEFRIELKSRD